VDRQTLRRLQTVVVGSLPQPPVWGRYWSLREYRDALLEAEQRGETRFSPDGHKAYPLALLLADTTEADIEWEERRSQRRERGNEQ
jgi:hypothetical protein